MLSSVDNKNNCHSYYIKKLLKCHLAHFLLSHSIVSLEEETINSSPPSRLVVFGGKSPCCNPINSVYSVKHTHFIMLNEWQHALYSFRFTQFQMVIILHRGRIIPNKFTYINSDTLKKHETIFLYELRYQNLK